MAKVSKKLPENVDGKFFVDSTCIDCDTCRQLAPEIFSDQGDYSVVSKQPENEQEERRAKWALLACPTASIGIEGSDSAKDRVNDFPLEVAKDIYYLGFNSEKSFGANSYFIKHSDGNWMIDSPRFTTHLQNKIQELGGLKYIFLTHQDDVADSAKYADKFAAKRILHQDDAVKIKPEIVLKGLEERSFGKDFLIIPVPGHTKGHCVLLFKNKYLFTGDHLSWDRYKNQLKAFRRACWYSWKEQIKSMDRLSTYSFDRILTGHGQGVALDKNQMRAEMKDLVERMKNV